MIQPILSYGNDLLVQKSLEVENNEQSKLLIVNLEDTIKSISNAMGLAAPQIGSLQRMFAIRLNGVCKIYINPVIRKRRKTQSFEEGCLSIPGIFHKLKDVRTDIIDIEYYDTSFNLQKERIRGIESIVFQHEYDHLMGTMFIDYMTKEGKESIREKLEEIENGKVFTTYQMKYPKTNEGTL